MADKTVDINPKTVKVLSEMLGKKVVSETSDAFRNVGDKLSDTAKVAFLEITGPYGKFATKAVKGFSQFKTTFNKEGGSTIETPDIIPNQFSDSEQIDGLGNLKEFEMLPDSLEDIKVGTEEQIDILRQLKEGIFSVDEMLARQFNYTKVQDKLESDRAERERKQIGDKTIKRSLLDRMRQLPGVGLAGGLVRGLGTGLKAAGKGVGLLAMLGIGEQTLKGFQEGGIKGGLAGLLGGGEGGMKGAGKSAARGAALGAFFGPLGIAIGGGIGGLIGFLGVDKLLKGFELFKGAMTNVFDWMKSTFDVEKIKAGIGQAFDIVTWLPKKILSFYASIGDYLFPNMMDALRSFDVGQIFKPVGDFLKEFGRSMIEGFISIIPWSGVRETMLKKFDTFLGPEEPEKKQTIVTEGSVLHKNPLQMTAPKAGYIKIKKVRHGIGDSDIPTKDSTRLDDTNIVAALMGIQDLNRKQLTQIERMNKQKKGTDIQITPASTGRTVPSQIENSLLFLLNRGEL